MMLKQLDWESIQKLNSLTKYPEIKTYHVMGGKGCLTKEMNFDFSSEDEVVLTEKIDGTNGRIVFLPNGEWLIGSREEFLTASGDVIYNTGLGIVDALRPVAEQLKSQLNSMGRETVTTFYFEVFGGGIGQYAKNYTTSKTTFGVRLFDIVDTYDVMRKILTMDRKQISSWRAHGGQSFLTEHKISAITSLLGLTRVPVLYTTPGDKLPTTVEGMSRFLSYTLESTLVPLDETARMKPEGLVLRTMSRSKIAKARFQDYARTLKYADFPS